MCCFVYKSIFNKSTFFLSRNWIEDFMYTLYEHWPTTRPIYTQCAISCRFAFNGNIASLNLCSIRCSLMWKIIEASERERERVRERVSIYAASYVPVYTNAAHSFIASRVWKWEKTLRRSASQRHFQIKLRLVYLLVKKIVQIYKESEREREWVRWDVMCYKMCAFAHCERFVPVFVPKWLFIEPIVPTAERDAVFHHHARRVMMLPKHIHTFHLSLTRWDGSSQHRSHVMKNQSGFCRCDGVQAPREPVSPKLYIYNKSYEMHLMYI